MRRRIKKGQFMKEMVINGVTLNEDQMRKISKYYAQHLLAEYIMEQKEVSEELALKISYEVNEKLDGISLEYENELIDSVIDELSKKELDVHLSAFDNSNKPMYAIFLLNEDDFTENQLHELMFSNSKELAQMGFEPNYQKYLQVYTGSIESYPVLKNNHEDILEMLYTKFNIEKPIDYHHHSMSVGDIVVLHDHVSKNNYTYMVDSFGFKELPNFLKSDNEIVPQKQPKAVENRSLIENLDKNVSKASMSRNEPFSAAKNNRENTL